MGLDVSHDAFCGAYSAFNRFRKKVAEAMGGSYPPHADPKQDEESWYWGDEYGPDTHPGLAIFFNHADHAGEIHPKDCQLLADELEALLPEIRRIDNGGEGHIRARGGYVGVTEAFIAGCREAFAKREDLEFL